MGFISNPFHFLIDLQQLISDKQIKRSPYWKDVRANSDVFKL